MGGYGCFFDPAVCPGFCISYAFCERQALVEAGHYPMPGDVVILTGEYSLCKKGDIGVIEGWVGVDQDEYLVCFNVRPAPFRGPCKSLMGRFETAMITGISPGVREVVSCSGGPALYLKASELEPWPHDYELRCWRWKDIPRADGGEDYKIRVPAWTWEGKS